MNEPSPDLASELSAIKGELREMRALLGQLVVSRDDQLLSDVAAAPLVGVSVSTLRKWRVDGRGPRVVRPSGGAVRYRRADLHDFLTSRTNQPGSASLPDFSGGTR